MPEDEQPLADTVPWLLALLIGVFLKDRDLHFKLVESVFEEEDLLGFGVGIPGSQSLEVSPANPAGESSCQQGRSDEQ
jgi:hypothetical protein